MPATKCERCGAVPTGAYELFDYCADCSRNLCAACMEKGCCGHVPAQSGAETDLVDDSPLLRRAWERARRARGLPTEEEEKGP